MENMNLISSNLWKGKSPPINQYVTSGSLIFLVLYNEIFEPENYTAWAKK